MEPLTSCRLGWDSIADWPPYRSHFDTTFINDIETIIIDMITRIMIYYYCCCCSLDCLTDRSLSRSRSRDSLSDHKG